MPRTFSVAVLLADSRSGAARTRRRVAATESSDPIRTARPRFVVASGGIGRRARESRHHHSNGGGTGVSGIFIVGPEVDPYDPAAVRAMMGLLFSQKLVLCSKQE